VASKGGNFLLDVGPTPEGTIQPEFVERLQAMGEWMKVNGDSIYGTTYGPWQNLPFGKTTAKGKAIYLHVFDWPSKPELELPAITSRVSRVTLLATGHKIRFKQKKDRLLITVPSMAPDPNDSVLKIEMR
jgi:alpha-L-fucosidase